MKAHLGLGGDNSVGLGQLTHHTGIWVLFCSGASHAPGFPWLTMDSLAE